jgi:FkbM family methyltransferase
MNTFRVLPGLKRRAGKLIRRARGLGSNDSATRQRGEGTSPSADDLQEHIIANARLLLPSGNRLPLFLKHNPQYNANLPRIAKQVKAKYAALTLIDVGANVGDTVAFLRAEARFPILCIEGDEQFFSILQKNLAQFADVKAVQAYVGVTTETAPLEINHNATTAQLVPSSSTADLQMRTLTDVLAQFPAFAQSKILKIDTDGYDGQVLRGARAYLEAVQPVVFFEYMPDELAAFGDNGLSLFPFLHEVGYRDALIYDNAGDLMLSLRVDAALRWQELHIYFSGRRGLRYMDLAVFAEQDRDLFENVRAAELEFCRRARTA